MLPLFSFMRLFRKSSTSSCKPFIYLTGEVVALCLLFVIGLSFCCHIGRLSLRHRKFNIEANESEESIDGCNVVRYITIGRGTAPE